MLKHNSKKTLDIIAGQVKRNARAAYLQTHPNSSLANAGVRAAELMAKPEAQIYLKEHVDQAVTNIVDMANDKEIKPETRLKANQDILDREKGRAVQQIHQTTQGVQLIIDLTSALVANGEAAPIKQ